MDIYDTRDDFTEICIEYPARGATYCREKYGVYGYGEYPDHSVLAGQTRRVYLGEYETLAEAQAAHPTATLDGPGYSPPQLSHLPDPDGPDPLGENRDAYEEGLLERGD